MPRERGFQFELDKTTSEKVDKLHQSENVSRVDVLRRSIALYELIKKIEHQGKKIEVIDKNGQRTQLEFVFI